LDTRPKGVRLPSIESMLSTYHCALYGPVDIGEAQLVGLPDFPHQQLADEFDLRPQQVERGLHPGPALIVAGSGPGRGFVLGGHHGADGCILVQHGQATQYGTIDGRTKLTGPAGLLPMPLHEVKETTLGGKDFRSHLLHLGQQGGVFYLGRNDFGHRVGTGLQ